MLQITKNTRRVQIPFVTLHQQTERVGNFVQMFEVEVRSKLDMVRHF